MDNERQRWLLSVIEATGRAADEIEAADDPYYRVLHADLVELRDRLRAELGDLDVVP